MKGKLWIIPTICTEAVNVKCRASKGSDGILITTATKGNAVQTLHNLLVSKPGQIAPCVLLFHSWVSALPSLCCSCHRKTGNESCSNLGTSVFPGSSKKHLFPVRMDVILISEVFPSGENQLFFMSSLCICLAQAEAGLSALLLWISEAWYLFPVGGCSVQSVMLRGEDRARRTHQCTPNPAPVCAPLVQQGKETQTCPWAQPHLERKITQRCLKKFKKVKIKPPPHLKETFPFKKGLNVIYFQRTRDRLRIAGTFSLTQIYIIVLNFSPFLLIILFLSL